VTGLQMAVLHLPTGHVVGAMTAGGQVPTVAQSTGGEHVAVRIPGGQTVRVPAELLTATAVPADPDVLIRPTHYAVTKTVPPVAWAGAPKAKADVASKAGREVLSIWDGGTQPEIARETLSTTGVAPAGAPPGATHRLLAVAGEPLMYET
jgi:hypothetical protein